VNEVPTDQNAAELQKCFVNVGPAFGADGQPAESVQPGQGALDDPPMPAQPFAGLDPSPGDAALDAPLSEVSVAKAMIVSLIGVEFLGSAAGPGGLGGNNSSSTAHKASSRMGFAIREDAISAG
jgi:hypothetical protein